MVNTWGLRGVRQRVRVGSEFSSVRHGEFHGPEVVMTATAGPLRFHATATALGGPPTLPSYPSGAAGVFRIFRSVRPLPGRACSPRGSGVPRRAGYRWAPLRHDCFDGFRSCSSEPDFYSLTHWPALLPFDDAGSEHPRVSGRPRVVRELVSSVRTEQAYPTCNSMSRETQPFFYNTQDSLRRIEILLQVR
jgi:hypothetical protein